mgnify:CR=1 FL=1
MKHFWLLALKEYLKQFSTIQKVRRTNPNTIEMIFDKDHSYFFDLTRSKSMLYKASSSPPPKRYNAPFDNLLESLLSYSQIISIEVPNNERIIRFWVTPKSSYKRQKIGLQFEFTGKYTNAILIDENEITIEALRHVDSRFSSRVVQPNIKLVPPPPRTYQEEVQTNFEINRFLENNFTQHLAKVFEQTKAKYLRNAEQKRDKFHKLLNSLASEETLKNEQQQYTLYGSIVLANLHKIKAYDTLLETYDFEGNPITIKLPENLSKNRISEYFFNLAKKAKNKIQHLHIEKENLKSKVEFYSHLAQAISEAASLDLLATFAPTSPKSNKSKISHDVGVVFWIDGYKVLVGRNRNENQKLLSLAKANDIWMHIQGIPSAHLIIKTDKQSLPKTLLFQAAKLCVNCSVSQAGNYLVDYTKRKFVRPQEGANVLYSHYETISITK